MWHPATWARRCADVRAESYRAAARAIRRMADDLEARADAETARERAARTRVIHRLSLYCRQLSARHRNDR